MAINIYIYIIIASFSELCNCATHSHFALYVCMYQCQSRLGPEAYQVMSYASAARVSRGYMVCARARVAWLHGLCPRACRVVTWFVPVRVSRGNMVCARVVTWFAPVRVSLDYMVCLALALAQALALPRVASWIRELQRCSVY